MHLERLCVVVIMAIYLDLTRRVAMVCVSNLVNMLKFILSWITDVNECSEGTDQCNQICTNTVGSYKCSCNAGYVLGLDKKTCVGTYKANFLV